MKWLKLTFGKLGRSFNRLNATFNSRNLGAFHISNGSCCSLLFETSRDSKDGNRNIANGILSKRLSCKYNSSKTGQG